MKRALLCSILLMIASAIHAQLEEDFTPNPVGWVLDQGAQFTAINGNDVAVTPAGGGNNPAVIGTPAVSKTSNTVKVCFDVNLYNSNLNSQLPFPCATYMDVLFVKSTVTTSNDAELPANILARVDNFLLATNGGAHCFTFNFPGNVVAADFKVFLSFHAACNQGGTKLVLDNVNISGVDEVCAGATCSPAALNDAFERGDPAELSFNAVLYGSNLNYPDPAGKAFDAGGTDNDQNDTYTHLQWSVVSQPINGSVVVNADGSCTITRNSTSVSQLTFTYRLCDDGPDNNFATTADNLCNDATVTINYLSARLPILLANFTVTRRDAMVSVKWTTTTESNNKQFEIQRSLGGGAYQTVALITSKAANGNSSTPLSYEFSESNATKQVAAYRLIQVDKDGTKTIYGAKMVRGMEAMSRVLLYPNPAIGGKVMIVFDDAQAKDIIISDLNGKAVQRWSNYSQTNLPVSGLRAGLYMVQITGKDGMEKYTQKLIVTQ